MSVLCFIKSAHPSVQYRFLGTFCPLTDAANASYHELHVRITTSPSPPRSGLTLAAGQYSRRSHFYNDTGHHLGRSAVVGTHAPTSAPADPPLGTCTQLTDTQILHTKPRQFYRYETIMHIMVYIGCLFELLVHKLCDRCPIAEHLRLFLQSISPPARNQSSPDIPVQNTCEKTIVYGSLA